MKREQIERERERALHDTQTETELCIQRHFELFIHA